MAHAQADIVERFKTMDFVQYFMIRAVSKPDNEDEQETGGAYISCWINFKLNDGAELLAKYYIEKAGWIPGKIEEHKWVDAASYETDSENRVFFEEAQQDGASFVWHSWPKDAEDANDEEVTYH